MYSSFQSVCSVRKWEGSFRPFQTHVTFNEVDEINWYQTSEHFISMFVGVIHGTINKNSQAFWSVWAIYESVEIFISNQKSVVDRTGILKGWNKLARKFIGLICSYIILHFIWVIKNFVRNSPDRLPSWPGARIMEVNDCQVTTVFTVQPSFHHRHSTNQVSWSVTIIGEHAVTPHLIVRRRW